MQMNPTNHLANQIGDKRPHGGEQCENRHNSAWQWCAGRLRGGARLMPGAEPLLNGGAITALACGAEIQARTLGGVASLT